MRGQGSTEYLVALVFGFFLIFARVGDQPSIASQLLTAMKNVQGNYSLGMSVVSYYEPTPLPAGGKDETVDEDEGEELPGCDLLPSAVCSR